MATVTPGTSTSEFKLTVAFVGLVVVCATVLAALDKLTADVFVDLVKWGGGVPIAGYALSRGIAKRGNDGSLGAGQ